METNFSANIQRFSGFADQYDSYRPAPPAALADLLTQLSQAPRPKLVVDLGSGTGLSTRYWADKAGRVIGIEPTPDMRRRAELDTAAPNISYRSAFSHNTGLEAHCAEIVTCGQSLHWMEPQCTFTEVARILAPGGVFAAYDYDWPPTTSSWEADAAYIACRKIVDALDTAPDGGLPLQRWSKSQHLDRMSASGCFRFTKEIVLHHTELGNAERLIGLLLSQGGVMSLLKRGLGEQQLGISQFRTTVQRVLGDTPQTWYWSARVRLGIV